MAHPKRKHSKARSRTRRAVYYGRLKAPTTMACDNCNETKLMHRACPNCGHYRGRQVVERAESL
jgi:large subunit ribosomal protein L32